MFCDFDVSSPTPSFDFEVTDVLFLVFVKGEELVEALPLSCVSPSLILGVPHHPVLCIVESGHRGLFLSDLHS